MKKNPSINIRLDDFLIVCADLGIVIDEPKALQLFKAATQYSATNRSVLQSSRSVVIREIQKKVARSSNSVNLFNRELYSQRLNLKHQGLRQILENDPVFPFIEKAAQSAERFSKTFVLSYAEGIPEFIRILLLVTGRKFNVKRINDYLDKVYHHYECSLAIKKDGDKKATLNFASAYFGRLKRSQFETVKEILQKDPREEASLIFARLECEGNRATYKDWITAQFEGLEFTGNIPMPGQLHGPNAVSRYLKWKVNNPARETSYAGVTDAEYWSFLKQQTEKFKTI